MDNPGSLKPTKKGNPCPVCGDTSSGCRIHTGGEIVLCATLASTTNLFDIIATATGNWKCLKVATKSRWVTFKLDNSQASEEERAIATARLAAIRQKAAATEKKRRESALDIPTRDKAIRRLAQYFPLADDHRQDLYRRGLSDKQIADGLYFTVEKGASIPKGLPKNLAGIARDRLVGGRGYACVAFQGGKAIAYQIRLDNLTKAKYRWATGDASSHLKNGELPLTSFIKNDGGIVYLMEGIQKAYIAHCRHDISVIGASGGLFASSLLQLKELLSGLEGREIVIVPDAGAISNPDVIRTLSQTEALIQGARYLWWNQTSKTDPDIDELDDISMTSLIDKLPLDEKDSLTVRSDHPESAYKAIADSLKLDLNDCATDRPFDAWVVDELLKDNWVTLAGDFYHWQENKGYWQKVNAGKVKSLIAKAGDRAYRLEYNKALGWRATPKHKKESTAFSFARDYLARDESEISTHKRTFRNGTLDCITGVLSPSKKEDFVTSFIDCDYIPNQECPPVFKAFLETSFGSEAIATIRAVTAMFLDPTAPWERFPYLMGASGGGKSTLGQVWGDLFADGYGAGDFDAFESPESRHHLSGLSLYGIPDVKGRLSGKGMTNFYKMVQNEPILARPLYQGAYTKRLNCRFWVASVNALSVEESEDGWQRRVLLIPVKGAPQKPDPYLRGKLRDCMGEIVSWAIAMPKQERDAILMERKAISEMAREIQLHTTMMGDSVRAFVDACLAPGENESLEGCDLHQAFLAFCQANIDRNSSMGYQKFISRLKSVIPANYVARKSTRVNGEVQNVPARWQNLKFNPGVFTIAFGSEANPVYTCIRRNCLEGGLEAIAQYWQGEEEVVQKFSSSVVQEEVVQKFSSSVVQGEERSQKDRLVADPSYSATSVTSVTSVTSSSVVQGEEEEEVVEEFSSSEVQEGKEQPMSAKEQPMSASTKEQPVSIKEQLMAAIDDESLRFCVECTDAEIFEDFYGLSNFKAKLPANIEKLEAIAGALSKPELKSYLAVLVANLKQWQALFQEKYSFTPAKSLTSKERLARANEKKQAKQTKRGDNEQY